MKQVMTYINAAGDGLHQWKRVMSYINDCNAVIDMLDCGVYDSTDGCRTDDGPARHVGPKRKVSTPTAGEGYW